MRSHIIAKQHFLIAKIEFAVGDDGMRPGIVAATEGLIEAPAFHVFVRIGFDQNHRSSFIAIVEPAVGVGDRAFARSVILPADLSGLEIQATERSCVRTIYAAVDQYNAAM